MALFLTSLGSLLNVTFSVKYSLTILFKMATPKPPHLFLLIFLRRTYDHTRVLTKISHRLTRTTVYLFPCDMASSWKFGMEVAIIPQKLANVQIQAFFFPKEPVSKGLTTYYYYYY